jgi:CBS domain containing-hemolysin-like protein
MTMTSADVAMLSAIVAMTLVSIALAVAETALTRMTKVKANALVDEGRRGAEVLAHLVESTERWLNPLLLVILALQLVQATLTGVLSERLFGGVGIAVAAVVNVAVVFVVAEAAPKTWAIQHTERAALLSARPVSALAAFPPLRLLSRALIGLTNVVLPGKGLKEGPFVSEEELLAVAVAAVEGSSIEEGERKLIESILEFGDTVVREVMVPRPDMVTVSSDFRVADTMEVVLLNGYSRIPATGEGIDDIVGIVFAKDLMRAERDNGDERPVSTLVRPARFVPETKPVHALLREMQAESFHMAVVVDEYGGTAGLVTLEDLIEELVGEIVDEYDREEPLVEPRSDGSVRVNASISVDELSDILHVALPEGDWDTVGGLVLHVLGRVPEAGEIVECMGWMFEAERVQGRRISRVVVQPASVPVPAADDAADDHDGRRDSKR